MIARIWARVHLYLVSWRLSLVGLSPVPFILAAAYFNIVYIEKYERQVQKPLEEASGFASENVDSIKVCRNANSSTGTAY